MKIQQPLFREFICIIHIIYFLLSYRGNYRILKLRFKCFYILFSIFLSMCVYRFKLFLRLSEEMQQCIKTGSMKRYSKIHHFFYIFLHSLFVLALLYSLSSLLDLQFVYGVNDRLKNIYGKNWRNFLCFRIFVSSIIKSCKSITHLNATIRGR